MLRSASKSPEYTANADAIGVLRLLEAIRILGMEKETRCLSGVDLGIVRSRPGSAAEGDTPSIRARPTASRNFTATGITVNYREAYGIYASNGILFNHESRSAAKPL